VTRISTGRPTRCEYIFKNFECTVQYDTVGAKRKGTFGHLGSSCFRHLHEGFRNFTALYANVHLCQLVRCDLLQLVEVPLGLFLGSKAAGGGIEQLPLFRAEVKERI
jgi:hypothetical protein